MEPERQPSRAEQRMLAVAKLKRAASLPRMKDGRRPPMHVEAVSEGEKVPTDDDKKEEADSPPPEVKTEEPPEVEPEYADREAAVVSPGPATRSKRRSRSRSRSRGSKDFKGKARATQSPTPSPLVTGDSSQDEDQALPSAIVLPSVPPLLSPIPSHFAEFQRSRLLRSPIPTSPEPSLFYPGTSPPTPILLPSLEALQKGMFRSNSAGSSAGRRMAMHKLTGGTEAYDPSPSPTPPPLPGKLGRNNTVSGGERTAARQILLSRLGTRITKEADGEHASAGEEITVPSPTPKRKRRRSGRGSTSANTGVSDSEFLSTSPNTPVVPPAPLPQYAIDNFSDLRAQSATPNQAASPQNQSAERLAEAAHSHNATENAVGHERPEPTRRRSVVVEEEEEEQIPPQPRYPGLPGTPPQRLPPHIAVLRAPHGSDAPSSVSTESTSPSAVGVPVYLSHRTPSRNDMFPSSPFTTPLKEKPSRDEDEEQVLYPADTYRPRTPYEDTFDREISWIASPVPEIRMPIDDDDEEDAGGEDEEDEEPEYDEPPLSARSSNFSPQETYDDTSPRVSSDSKSLIVESEISPDNNTPYGPPSPSSLAAPSHSASAARASDGSMSPQVYPTRLSIASRIQSDRSPLNGEFGDWDDRILTSESSGKRNGDTASTSTWEKVKSTFSRAGSSAGRRSRTNSIVTRERRDQTDSSVSRESGASLTSAKTDKQDVFSAFAHQQTQQPLMQSPSASASILSLAPYPAPRGSASPIPPASSADLSKYQNAKLFPFPGMKKLEEQRNRAKGIPTASASSPDVTYGSNDDEQPLVSAGPFSNTPAHIPESTRDRKLSHQASDTRLLPKYNSNLQLSPAFSPSRPDYLNVSSQLSAQSAQNTGSLSLKLPMTLPGVKQWLSKNNKKIFSSQASTPSSSPPAVEVRPAPNPNKKASLTDLLKRKDNDSDWEEINSTPTSISGDTLQGKRSSIPESRDLARGAASPAGLTSARPERTEHTDTEKTPKAKKVMPAPEHDDAELSYMHFDNSSAPSSRPDPLSSTPDPSSSLSDYPAHSTSESSSTTSSQYSLGGRNGPQGSIVLERLDENLARGSRSPMWASAIDDPARKLILSSPVLQVVNPNTVKDRFLFLFTDILVIAKPVIQDQDNSMDSYKPSPLDRKFVVKSVVLLNQLRFNADRTEPQAKTSTYAVAPRNPLIRSFVHQFSKDPDHAVTSLFSKSGIADDPIVLGQLLFKTLDLDRARLGDYLSRRTSKSVLKAFLDSFGFIGLRVDKALRVFLHSLNVPNKSSHNSSTLDYMLDAFAGRWYEANARIVAYDKDLAIRLVRALVQLNDLLHDGITQESGPTGYPKRDVTSRDFIDAFRRYDVRGLVADDVLHDVYEAIREERLSQAPKSSSGIGDVCIMIKRPLPTRLTYKNASDPIILRIPQADPQLTIRLYGQDLVFDPPVLTFTKSSEASFRVMGTSLGSKTMIMCRSGPTGLRYSGLPLSNSLVVERAFMRNTFQMAFLNHSGTKRRYMFSVDDPLIRHQWSVSLKHQIDSATAAAGASMNSVSPAASKFHRAAENVAFKVLQETLIGAKSSLAAPASIHRALSQLNATRHHGRNGSASQFLPDQRSGPGANNHTMHTVPSHARSKSRSKVYHRGAGKNELDLNYESLGGHGSREVDGPSPYDQDHSARADGPLWSHRDLELHCQQNSSIALVLSYLQIGAPGTQGQGS